MRAGDFKRWRKALNLSQKEAAHALGLKRRVVQYYEKGERDGKRIDIPRAVRLACAAIAMGIEDYDGPPKGLEETALEEKKARSVAKRAAEAGRQEKKVEKKKA